MGIPYAEVIGDPIAHSKSPLIHKFWLEKLGIAGDYRACRVAADELGDYFRRRMEDPDWRGCNISMPHKLAARAHVAHRQDPSFPLWPINLAFRAPDGSLQGEEFDSPGFVMSLIKLEGSAGSRGPALGGRSGAAIIVGAGSAARLVAWGLAHFGYDPIWISSRHAAKAQLFAEHYRNVGARALPPDAPTPPVDILVNATPLGMAGMPEANIDLAPLPEGALVYDLVYDPQETGLLRRARERGLRTVNGFPMLIEQAAPSFRRLFGIMPPRAHDEALNAMLTQ